MRHEDGFTLIEMLIVLVMVGLAFAALPTLLTGLAHVRLRAAANDVVTQLRSARSQALLTGVPAALIIDPARRSLQTPSEDSARPLPAVVERLTVEPISLTEPDGAVHLRFFADGGATPVRLVLVHGALAVGIRVDRLTGRVDRDD